MLSIYQLRNKAMQESCLFQLKVIRKFLYTHVRTMTQAGIMIYKREVKAICSNDCRRKEVYIVSSNDEMD